MYTNIDTAHTLDAISNFLGESHPEIPAQLNIDVDILLSGLDMIMNNTTYKFGNTYWIQQYGTAMGSPAAPMYAILYFVIHEMDIIPKQKNIIFYDRYIDDTLGIWLPDESLPDSEDDKAFINFKKTYNSFGNLTWEFSTRSTSVHFLDIVLTIKRNKILVSPYEKSLNLYLYIPPRSAHPPHGLHSLISGRITTCQDSLKKYLKKLKLRLLAQGYSTLQIQSAFQKSLQTPWNSTIPPDLHLLQKKPPCVFLHYVHHPHNVPPKKIHHLLSEVLLNPPDNTAFKDLHGSTGKKTHISKVIVYHHRPKNLGHFLSPQNLPDFLSVKKLLYQPTEILPCREHSNTLSGSAIDTASQHSAHNPSTRTKKVRFNPYYKTKRSISGNKREVSQPKITQPSGETPYLPILTSLTCRIH